MSRTIFRFCFAIVFLAALVACNKSETEPETIFSFNDLTVEKINSKPFGFLEGPAWDGEDTLYFTDIPNNLIYAYQLSTNAISEFLNNSEGTNGLLFDRSGNLLMCQQDSGRVSRLDMQTKAVTEIIGEYDGTRFNRPNDIITDKYNNLYFTDPSWSENRPQEIKGVYFYSADGELKRIIEDMVKPNGIILSPEEKYLYVVDSGNFTVRRYATDATSIIKNGIDFAKLPTDNSDQDSNADGLAVDTRGNLYVSYRYGVSVFDKEGMLLGKIEVPEGPTNLEFGGKDLNILFITAPKNLYKTVLPVTGVRFPQ